MPSFATTDHLATHLHSSVDTASAQQALDSATGLLRNAARPALDTDPDPIPAELRAWTLDLAALIYENPGMRETEEAGDVVTGWSYRRRAEILAEATRAYRSDASSVASFPPAFAWPAW